MHEEDRATILAFFKNKTFGPVKQKRLFLLQLPEKNILGRSFSR